jgi:hypothetical protein
MSDAETKLFDDSWRLSVAVQLAIMQALSDDILALQAPSSLSSIDEFYKEIGRDVYQFTNLMAEGIDDLDADKINSANDLLQHATSNAKILTTMINEFKSSR